MRLNVVFTSIFALLLISLYQNCSDVQFAVKPKTETFFKSLNASSTDILFVIDDSSSMNIILENVRNGVNSMSSVNYPANTRMAVTYMSPAKINSNGSLDLNAAHTNYSINTPGFLQLVTAASINNYLSTSGSSLFPEDPARAQRYEEGKINVTSEACVQAWFDPASDEHQGEPCFQPASLTPRYGTGVEAGLTSLKQLVDLYSDNQEFLFRPNAKVFIVFVSDTHDPGAPSYYGESGNPTSIPTYTDLRASILNNTPNIDSIKFSGIVPVPAIGNPLLENLKVIGQIPDLESYDPNQPNATTSRIYKDDPTLNKGEKLWDFSYVDVIKKSQGVIAHPTTDDWSLIINDLLSEVQIVNEVRLQLSSNVTTITAVRVNGITISPENYFIDSDGMSIVIQMDFDDSQNYDFQIDYL